MLSDFGVVGLTRAGASHLGQGKMRKGASKGEYSLQTMGISGEISQVAFPFTMHDWAWPTYSQLEAIDESWLVRVEFDSSQYNSESLRHLTSIQEWRIYFDKRA